MEDSSDSLPLLNDSHLGDIEASRSARVAEESVAVSFVTVSNSYLQHPSSSPMHNSLMAAASSGSYYTRSSGLPSLVDVDATRIVYDDDKDDSSSVQSLLMSQCYFNVPWSPQVYFTVRGSENFHIYLWIAKDLSWTQNWYFPSLVFGIAALAWCAVLLYHALKSRCFHEGYMFLALLMWLVANFVWMSNEVVSSDIGSRGIAGNCMAAALSYLLVYHLFLRPLRLLPPDPSILQKKYDMAQLRCRFSEFFSWRQYEHLHTFFWLAKDFSWNRGYRYPWCVFSICTVFLGLDFVVTTSQLRHMFIDRVHYIAQLIWVVGNMVWAMGELFNVPAEGSDDTPYDVLDFAASATARCRWWSSWLLIFAYLPIVLLYLVWLPLTCMGKIKVADRVDL